MHPGGPTEEMMLRDFKVRIEEAMQFFLLIFMSGTPVPETLNALGEV